MARTKGKRKKKRPVGPIGNALNNQARTQKKEEEKVSKPSMWTYIIPIGAAAGVLLLGSYAVFRFAYNSRKQSDVHISAQSNGSALESQASGPDPGLTFAQACNNPELIGRFLQEYSSPEVADAKQRGLLRGLLCEPTDETLERVLREVISAKLSDEKVIQARVSEAVKGYHLTYERAEGAYATVLPATVGLFGEGMSEYIAVRRRVFSPSSGIKNDADFRSLIRHELKHCEDWSEGVNLGNDRLCYQSISPDTFSLDYLHHLMELRAVYTELEGIFREKLETGRPHVSMAWLASQCGNYKTHWNFVKNRSATPLESRVGQRQLEEYRGIAPISKGDILNILFDLYGKKETLEARE
ncbi:hypothetical protein KY360_00235 [Candidatus Woesearchaeota archaeon]|nr:hypothetical protein [Candidatus Woesearchaeota archaeon]